uniref:C-type lectin domain-containing protein n=1 Tax=Maylandia zebra TaxID=106582 RepID=A0A3P9CLS9_9CICH
NRLNAMLRLSLLVENSMTPSDILVENSMTPSDILVENSMTWSDAQSYCRQTYTDLSTITNTQDNSQVASMLSDTAGAWIGLYRKYWTWSNSSRASNLPWGPGQPDDSVNCATIVRSTGSFNSHNCDDQRPFLCSRGESVLCVSAQSGPPGLIRTLLAQHCRCFGWRCHLVFALSAVEYHFLFLFQHRNRK